MTKEPQDIIPIRPLDLRTRADLDKPFAGKVGQLAYVLCEGGMVATCTLEAILPERKSCIVFGGLFSGYGRREVCIDSVLLCMDRPVEEVAEKPVSSLAITGAFFFVGLLSSSVAFGTYLLLQYLF